MHPVLNAVVGGWSITGVGRIQTVLMDFGNVRLVGMSESDLQNMYKFYEKPNPATGIDEVWMLPEDVILNTRRAFSTSNTTTTGIPPASASPRAATSRLPTRRTASRSRPATAPPGT